MVAAVYGVLVFRLSFAERFRIFGGVARYCSIRNDTVYINGLQERNLQVHKIDSYTQMRDALKETCQTDDSASAIFHCVKIVGADSPFVSLCSRQFASKDVEKMLSERIRDSSGSVDIYRWLKRCCFAPNHSFSGCFLHRRALGTTQCRVNGETS